MLFDSLFKVLLNHYEVASLPIRHSVVSAMNELVTLSCHIDMETITSLLYEMLQCYNRCVLDNHSDVINTCSELFIQFITNVLQAMDSPSIPALWSFLCYLTAPAMGDAPLAPLETVPKSEIIAVNKAWMWQVDS